ncbi:phosphatase PAP2 family protein [Hoyosella sp. YIM 151337]|uniref:bifunctional phosphatase PAP2/diacylglycerol kinase family protein n=1 Tax=Hoyosella sp. YIM 151337 TaxID=2992742 RepID=UPI0022369970|nr:bifunctional phosphatase PAP2/diacylglycerol kinase family protein [Hoyosella sp. YIM 151337]MCW4354361.1 phosphatase PAP2 family protein [Hoyosella sp. YIM 151337]
MKPAFHVSSVDRYLVERTARWGPSVVDRIMAALSRAANRGMLWIGISSILYGIGGKSRRAAVRGVLSLALSSLIANAALKWVFPRHRPPADAVPLARRTFDVPRSSSFPSGHSALAAAYATGILLESRPVGAAVAPVAAAVAYSRVHTGVHWPSDVIAGAAVGSMTALATRRWWATVTDEPALPAETAPAPALPRGEGLLVFTNPRSGSPAVIETLHELLPAAKFETPAFEDSLSATHDALVATIRAANPAAVGVCGGDGTVRTLAAAAMACELPLAVFPGGTLNHFAADTGVCDVSAVVGAIERGSAYCLDTAEVRVDSGEPITFINTASIGGYPSALQTRKKWQRVAGKWIPLVTAMAREIAASTPLPATMNGERTALRLLFVGNGHYAPVDRIPVGRTSLAEGKLDVRYMRADARLSYLRALYAVFTGTLRGSHVHRREQLESLDIEITNGPVPLALDGDPLATGTHFEFRSRHCSLTLYASGGS